MNALLVYIACPDLASAQNIGKTLINERLAACYNIFPTHVESGYFWNGQAHNEHEIVMTVKTMEDRFADLNRRVKEIHPYQVPCVIGLPIAQANREYLDWLRENTRPPQMA